MQSSPESEVDDGYDEEETTSSSHSDGGQGRIKPAIPGEKFSPEMVKKYGVSGLVWRPHISQPRRYKEPISPRTRPNQSSHVVETVPELNEVSRSLSQGKQEQQEPMIQMRKYKYNLKTTPAEQLFGMQNTSGNGADKADGTSPVPATTDEELPEFTSSEGNLDAKDKEYYNKMRDEVCYAQIQHPPIAPAPPPAPGPSANLTPPNPAPNWNSSKNINKQFNEISTQTQIEKVSDNFATFNTVSSKPIQLCYHHPIPDPTKVVELDPQPNNRNRKKINNNCSTLYTKFLRKPAHSDGDDEDDMMETDGFSRYMWLPNQLDVPDLSMFDMPNMEKTSKVKDVDLHTESGSNRRFATFPIVLHGLFYIFIRTK